MRAIVLILALAAMLLAVGRVAPKSTLQFVWVTPVSTGKKFTLREEIQCTLEDYASTVGWDATFYFKAGTYEEVAQDQQGAYFLLKDSMFKWVHGGVPFFVRGGIYVPADPLSLLRPWRVTPKTASFMVGNTLMTFHTGSDENEVILDGPLSPESSVEIRTEFEISLQEPNRPPQTNAGSRPSSGDSTTSETPSAPARPG